MEREIKIYRVKIYPATGQREVILNVSLMRDENLPSQSKTDLLTDKDINIFFEPPTLARFIRLQTISNTKISLCEVETYGTGAYVF